MSQTHMSGIYRVRYFTWEISLNFHSKHEEQRGSPLVHRYLNFKKVSYLQYSNNKCSNQHTFVSFQSSYPLRCVVLPPQVLTHLWLPLPGLIGIWMELAVLISNIPRTAMLPTEIDHSKLEFSNRESPRIPTGTISHCDNNDPKIHWSNCSHKQFHFCPWNIFLLSQLPTWIPSLCPLCFALRLGAGDYWGFKTLRSVGRWSGRRPDRWRDGSTATCFKSYAVLQFALGSFTIWKNEANNL